ncbi:hypothetical protein EDC04DRAFT_2895021 [Pisolithus marmoratus]|nr:hypothetical protein EDC04DRAFT_2895021 [Pisolithus marmoratus]
MGFFSARKPGDKYLEPDRSVVQVIRSRFHDIYKARRWEASPHPSTSHLPRFGVKSPSRRGGDRESRHSRDLSHSPRSPLRSPGQTSPSPRPMPRAHTDAITSSLALRLNELAAANAEGLLSDDEYRLLRQSIFERLASHSSVPTESPVIPIGSQKHSPQLPDNSSQSCVKAGRTPSVRSKASVSSVVSNLFRRNTRRVSGISKEGTSSETSSIFSAAPSAFRRRGIPRELRNEDSSRVETTASGSVTISSPSKDGEAQHQRGLGSMSYRSLSRSVRRLDSPPSSFLNRSAEPRHLHSILTSEALQDDEVKTSRAIRHEIEAMEAEAMRVLDAFNGVELSVLTRSHHKPGHVPLRSPTSVARRNENDFFHGNGASTSGRGTPYHVSDADGSSLRSSTSYGTSASQPRSHRPNPLLKALLPPLVANRKRSASSLSSGAWASPPTASPTMTQPQLRDLGSVSSVNLARSLAPHSVASIDEDSEISVMESELVDIRRRRQEVTSRYQDRLEYLRAQLKGAELREKLLRK